MYNVLGGSFPVHGCDISQNFDAIHRHTVQWFKSLLRILSFAVIYNVCLLSRCVDAVVL